MDAELKQYLDEFSERNAAELRQMREENAVAHEETRRVLRSEMTEKISEAVSTLRGEMAAEHAETRRHFDITVERWETRFDLLAESVQLVDQKLDRNVAEIREEIATIKFVRPTRTRRIKR